MSKSKIDNPPKSKSIVERNDGRILKRMTIYMDPELARELRIQCAMEEIKISTGIANAVRKVLDSKGIKGRKLS